MNLSLHEINHILTALEKMSSYDVARAREMISEGVTVRHLKTKGLQTTFTMTTLLFITFCTGICDHNGINMAVKK